MERQVTIEFALQETARLYLELRSAEGEINSLRQEVFSLKKQLEEKPVVEAGKDEVLVPGQA